VCQPRACAGALQQRARGSVRQRTRDARTCVAYALLKGMHMSARRCPVCLLLRSIQSERVEDVKRAALSMDYPLMDEYDFRSVLNVVRCDAVYVLASSAVAIA
jgi:hypothetical protein